MFINWKVYCSDPFHWRRIYACLQVVPEAIIEAHPSLSIHSGDRTCCNCLNKLRKLPPEATVQDEVRADQPGPSGLSYHVSPCSESIADTEDSDTDDVRPADVQLLAVNEVLELEGISPLGGKRRTRSYKYVRQKIRRVENVFRKRVLFAVGA